jgi:hypothetical protein
MALKIGIVGLPNAGKSTLFNALVGAHQAKADPSRLGVRAEGDLARLGFAKTANYPFTTIEPNVGIVVVPDNRLLHIANCLSENHPVTQSPNHPTIQSSNHPIIPAQPAGGQSSALVKVLPATIEFVDIAGLLKDAHKGEGLGNEFLSHIRSVDAILLLLRHFESKNVPHSQPKIDPYDDLQILETELELADVNKALSLTDEQKLIEKPRLVVVNVAERDLAKSFDFADLVICAKTEEELLDLAPEERKDYLKELGLKKPVLDQLIQKAYKLLNLITFYTLKPDQVQAWPIPKNTLAPVAAGKVHTDMEKGFIKAEVVLYEDFVKAGNWQKVKDDGKLRTEGKDYIIGDGDVVHFLFNK